MNRSLLTTFFPAIIFTVIAAARVESQPADPESEDPTASFVIHPEFQIELAAMEPVVLDPVDLKFDERGRAFVLEMAGYPTAPRDPKLFPGKIVLMEDTDDDGRYDKRTVFADSFRYADGILPYRGGLLVASPPDILFLKDTDGDGVADQRDVVLSGFAVGNPQHNISHLTHGLDNWIYAANGGNSGNVYWPKSPDAKTSIRRNDFRFRIDESAFERIGVTSGGFGLAMDEWGRICTTHNIIHISQIVFSGRYTENAALPRSNTLHDISDHSKSGLARIFPLGVQETRVNHPEQSGYFSGSCGITYYNGGSFPEPFNGNIFVLDVVLNLVHRDVLRPDGPAFLASRGRERVEFLASTDRAFRPVTLTVGPDGALYLCDFHRDVIEHPEWIPDEIERTLDIDAGKTQGRIYRISPKGGLPRVQPRFDRGNLEEVVSLLGHRNKWWRDTAQRLLVEWGDKSALPLLRDLLANSTDPLARLHAMWTLHGLGDLDEPQVLKALADDHPGIRENALIISEDGLSDSPPRLDAVLALSGDADPRVRMQTALTLSSLGRVGDPATRGRIDDALERIATRDIEERWTRLAVLAAARHNSAPLFQSLASDYRNRPRAHASYSEMFGSLAHLAGRSGNESDIAAVMSQLTPDLPNREAIVASVLDGLTEGISRSGRTGVSRQANPSLARALAPLLTDESPRIMRASWKTASALGLEATADQQRILSEAADEATNPSLSLQRRLDSLALLELSDFASRRELLFGLLDIKHPKPIQTAAIGQLGAVGDQDIARRLLSLWKSLGPELRNEAGDILLYRRGNHDLLLTALENGDLSIGQFNLDLERRRTLLRSSNEETRRRAAALFSDAGVVTRSEAIERMRPALDLAGDPAKGIEHYKNLCAECHVIGSEGTEVGPNITDIFRKSAETLLHDILDPNAAVDTEYIGYTIVRKSGEIVNGILAEETDTTVTLREAKNVETVIPRSEIEEMYAGGISLMPEALEEGLSHQEMADLIAFLQQPR